MARRRKGSNGTCEATWLKIERLAALAMAWLLCASAACSSPTASPVSEPIADGGFPEAPPPCGPSTIEGGTFPFPFEGATYSYIVHLPPSYDGIQRMPLLLNWHGFTSNAQQQEIFSNMDPISDEEGFILVYPNSPDGSWNAGTCCGSSTMRNDVGFARALVEEISSQACIDSKRVYTTGMSNGGFMSFRLGCEAADLFAAVAPVAGKVGVPNCHPARSVPLLAFHGTADSLVAYETGALSADNLSVPDTVAKWAEEAGCTQGPDTTQQRGQVTCRTWSACRGGVTTTLCTVEGGEHCWPGQSFCPFGTGMGTTDIDASREMAAFFKRFKLP